MLKLFAKPIKLPSTDVLKAEYKRVTRLNARLRKTGAPNNQAATDTALRLDRELKSLGVPELDIITLAHQVYIEEWVKMPGHLQYYAQSSVFETVW